MLRVKEMQFQIEDRDGEGWARVRHLLDALGWEYYPTNVTGEEIDAGNDSDESKDETVEVPIDLIDVYEMLDECGVLDNI